MASEERGLTMAWTQEREDLLRKLWLQGLSASQIAYVMAGVTRNAVIGKAHRMGLPKRSPSTSHRPKPRVQRGKPSLAFVSGKPAPKPAPADIRYRKRVDLDVEQSIFETEHSSVSAEERRTLMTLTARSCKWPIGDPAEPDFHFCSRDADHGRSYCELHNRMAYQDVRRRRRRAEQVEEPAEAPQPLPLRAAAG